MSRGLAAQAGQLRQFPACTGEPTRMSRTRGRSNGGSLNGKPSPSRAPCLIQESAGIRCPLRRLIGSSPSGPRSAACDWLGSQVTWRSS